MNGGQGQNWSFFHLSMTTSTLFWNSNDKLKSQWMTLDYLISVKINIGIYVCLDFYYTVKKIGQQLIQFGHSISFFIDRPYNNDFGF